MQFKMSPKKILLCLLIHSPACYVAACCVFSNSRKEAFYQIQTGDTRQAVRARFGTPTHVEREEVSFKHYSTTPCVAPCIERLWFENRLNTELEVCSVELDRHDRVVEKNYPMSL
ncbi:hypothetical protein GCN78_23485 [Janthinobacterium rivuli]|uniref:hypothetical protein n=1 Tax=Janthinobacterium sp. FT68W TaxID=2654255 RepID=UPI001264E4BA|nr:hypothetical protein [Janthinobacterium sp. FT68W]KAB8046656.1 hypothetical protein GCN78_23485 [Janthinobacterium sp. FT68W]